MTAELRRLLSAATPGRWVDGQSCVYVDTGHAVGDPDAPDSRFIGCRDADAALIAAMRNELERLLDVVDAAEDLDRECRRNRSAIDEFAAAERLQRALEVLRAR